MEELPAVLDRRDFVRHNDRVRKGAIDRSSKRKEWCSKSES